MKSPRHALYFSLATIISLLATTLEGYAEPQWIPVSSNGLCHANYNATIKKADHFTIPVSCVVSEEKDIVTGIVAVYCGSWTFAGYLEGKIAVERGPIGRNTLSESVAMLVCK